MTNQAAIAQVLAGHGPILLDFDGPVCSVFAGYPAADVAAELRSILTAEGISVPDLVAHEDDPLADLRWTASLGEDRLTCRTEAALATAELTAVETAEPTPFAEEAIAAAHHVHRPVAVVSNNSATAVRAYLNAHKLTAHIEAVIGRNHAEPGQMKPQPEPIVRALHQLRSKPASAVMIGDSASDILSARAAGTRSIGYANKAAKTLQLQASGADAIVLSMADIARTLLSLRTS